MVQEREQAPPLAGEDGVGVEEHFLGEVGPRRHEDEADRLQTEEVVRQVAERGSTVATFEPRQRAVQHGLSNTPGRGQSRSAVARRRA